MLLIKCHLKGLIWEEVDGIGYKKSYLCGLGPLRNMISLVGQVVVPTGGNGFELGPILKRDWLFPSWIH